LEYENLNVSKEADMLIEQAIKTAIEYEQKIRDVYREAAKASSDEVGRQIFSALAADEANHVSYLVRQLERWVTDNKITWEDLKIVLPKAAEMSVNLNHVKEAMEPSKKRDELALLEQARDAERETCDFYEKIVSELPPEGKALFQQFLTVEAEHFNVVQFQIDSLTGSGFWMGWPEFDMEMMD
jgi:rubrerythrin